jgi:hypothetical protein
VGGKCDDEIEEIVRVNMCYECTGQVGEVFALDMHSSITIANSSASSRLHGLDRKGAPLGD